MSTTGVVVLGTEDLLAKLTRMTPAVRNQLILGMQASTIKLQGYVVANKLSGDPLKRRSGDLSNATQQDVEATEDNVIGKVTNNMAYAHVHEDGGIFQIPAHMMRWSHAVTKLWGNENAKRKVLKVRGTAEVKAHTATYPQRAFMRPSYEALKDWITQTLRDSATAGIKQASSGQ